jgi:hypothetical protein
MLLKMQGLMAWRELEDWHSGRGIERPPTSRLRPLPAFERLGRARETASAKVFGSQPNSSAGLSDGVAMNGLSFRSYESQRKANCGYLPKIAIERW